MPATAMRAIINDEYGPPAGLQLRQIDKPSVDEDGVLVRVRAVSINPLDWHLMRGQPYVLRIAEGPRRPKTKILGVDIAGQVEAVGRGVTEFQPGQEVFGHRGGSLAEYVHGQPKDFAPKPARLTLEQAAAVPVAGFTALQAVRDQANLKPSQRVLINGASGGVGTFAVQIAKAFGAEVTGVCSTANLELVESIGADHVVDYNEEDFTRGGRRYDVILDNAGNRALSEYRRVLADNGTLVLVGAGKGQWVGPMIRPLRALVLSRFVRQRMRAFIAKSSKDDLVTLKELIDAGRVTPVIDRVYPLTEISDAMGYLETGHARGKIIIAVDGA
jgi:NADPH:quinone reductase-like Zn-dependent oxidoreductase